jgi:plasmid stabilization system protein ParE
MVNSSRQEHATDRTALPPIQEIIGAAVHHLQLSNAIKPGGKMPRGDKSKYTDKEKRQAEHIEEGYEKRGTPEDEAKRRAWATVNAVHGGGEKPGGGGFGKPENHEPMRTGGRTSHKGGAH